MRVCKSVIKETTEVYKLGYSKDIGWSHKT